MKIEKLNLNADSHQILNIGHSWKTKQPWIMINQHYGVDVVWRTSVLGLSGGSGIDTLTSIANILLEDRIYELKLNFYDNKADLFVNSTLVGSSLIDVSRVQYDDVHFVWASYDGINGDLPANGSLVKNIEYCKYNGK